MSLARKIAKMFGAGGSAYTPGGEQNANSTLTTSSAGGGQAHPNLQPTLVVNYVIKT